jgi:quinolinate synthase
MESIQEEIIALKKQKNAVLLAHYYQTGDIIDIADMVGDSYALSRQAKETQADIIVFCGVRFMAESAKILNPDRKVLLPAMNAGCPMADMVTPQDILRLRAQYPDAAVACYVNSTAETKAEVDICVTSSNAVKVIASLPQKRVIFVPDKNLARYVADQLPEKEIIPYSGYCIVHDRTSAADAEKALAAQPDALLLAHPECPEEVTRRAHYVGSTAGILKYARESGHKKFIIGTEQGILHVLQKENPDKQFYLLSPQLFCTNMKKTRIGNVLDALRYEQYEITLDQDIMDRARVSLERMLKV